MGASMIKIENVSKLYRLGEVSMGTISHDLNRWWHRVRGKEDPYLKLGEENRRDTRGGEYIWALKDLSFEVQQGEVLGIIGRNGAGKSTLLKLLSRVTAPTTGVIKAKGRIASLLEVGTGFHPELTGRENIFLNGAILGMTKFEIKKKFDAIVDFSGVERYIDTPVKRYSSGMYVRLAFAVAAYLEPEILVVDEILAVGDAEFQKKCLGKIKDVSDREGRTVLFVSHNMGAIKNLCKNVLVLNKGKYYFKGEVTKGIKAYFASTAEDQKDQELKTILGNTGIDELITWHNVRITQTDTATNEVHNDENLEIIIDYELKDDIIGFRLIISIEDFNEICLFKSFFDERNNWGSSMQKGLYRSRVKIPPDILIEGAYCLRVFGTVYNVRMLNPLKGVCLHFDVYQTGEISRIQYPEDFRGLITLPVVWQTQPVNSYESIIQH
jgi:lipopolysaccharide transport system ATP-binding protein